MSDDTTCPLCGKPNRCAMAEDQPVTQCWCASAIFTPEVLEAIPVEDRGVRCICPACAQSLAQGAA